MSTIPELFGSMVFGDAVMRQRLPHDTYKALRKTIDEGKPLDLGVANVVANAMKDWACEKGATHFTHWFQSLNGITSEKHDSFINPSQGLHRLGPHQLRLYQGRSAVHPHRLLQLHRRSAG